MRKSQEKLYNYVDSLNSLPHSIILFGDIGSEYLNVCSYIASKFNLNILDISNNINNEYMFEIKSNLTPTLYYINLFELGIREQNIILKLFEEPSKYSYIILNVNSSDFILDTIKSRSYILKFDNYSKEYLKDLITPSFNDFETSTVLSICTTPGLIDIANHTNISELYNLCVKIVSNMQGANFQNTLNIANKINYKDLYDKFDLIMFIKMLKYVLLNSSINDRGAIYDIVLGTTKNINLINNKQQMIEQLLIKIWKYFN